jgi:hypothetical protein
MPEADLFDPIAVLQALDRHRVSYVVIGGLGRVIHGSDELTNGIDIVPSTKPENIRRLELSLSDVSARRSDGKAIGLEQSLESEPVLELQTAAGERNSSPSLPVPEATMISAAPRHASHWDVAFAPQSHRSVTTHACSRRSTASKTSSRYA